MKVISAAQMRDLDRQSVQAGIAGAVLMERAGAGAATEIAEFADALPASLVRRFVFLAGKGNNGGDAYVAARYLHQMTALPIVLYSIVPLELLQGDALINARRMPQEIKIRVPGELAAADFQPGDIIIDGLLGTGISGALKPPYPQWLAAVNASGRPVVALDLPSGIDADTGAVTTAALRADLTIVIALPKPGLYLGQGPELCGRLRCVDIGIPPALIAAAASEVAMPFAADPAARLGRIPADCHKNSRGRVGIIGGSTAYPGAPLLAARAAMRTGAGYVRLMLPNAAGRPTAAPDSLVIDLLPDLDGRFGRDAVEPALALLARTDAFVLGPGLDRGPELSLFLAAVLNSTQPVVIDADALNLPAADPTSFRGGPHQVLTPHPGEMQRLLSGLGFADLLNAARLDQAAGLARRTGSTVVLKGHRTVIAAADGRCSVNSSGTPGLAKAGSGDCLSGMIGTLLAQGMDSFDAAETAVFIHGYAAELSPVGARGMTADDLPQLAAEAIRRLSPFA